MSRCFKSLAWVLCASVVVSSCSGGGSNDEVDPVPEESGVSKWKISAQVSRDDCGERLAAVNQTITLVRNGDSFDVDTTIVKVGASNTEDGFTFGFEEATGECVRKYDTRFSSLTETTANVGIAVSTSCGTFHCQDEWTGTASKSN